MKRIVVTMLAVIAVTVGCTSLLGDYSVRKDVDAGSESDSGPDGD